MLKWIPIAVVAIYMLKGLCTYVQTVLMNFIGQRVVADIRNRLYQVIQTQSMSFFTKNQTGILMSRITNDVNSMQGSRLGSGDQPPEGFLHPHLSDVRDFLPGLAAGPRRHGDLSVTIYPLRPSAGKLEKLATRTQVTMGSLTTLLQETISGARIVKAFGREDYESSRFSRENENLLKLTLKSVTISAVSSPFMEFLGGVGIAAIIFYGGYQVIQGVSTPGTFFSFLAALILLYEPIKRLTNVNNTIQQGIAGRPAGVQHH